MSIPLPYLHMYTVNLLSFSKYYYYICDIIVYNDEYET